MSRVVGSQPSCPATLHKARLVVDEERGIARQAEMMSAENLRGEALIQADQTGCYADKAYDTGRCATSSPNWDRGPHRFHGQAQRGAGEQQVWFNKTASSVRVGVERANPMMKNWRGMARVRGLAQMNENAPSKEPSRSRASRAP